MCDHSHTTVTLRSHWGSQALTKWMRWCQLDLNVDWSRGVGCVIMTPVRVPRDGLSVVVSLEIAWGLGFLPLVLQTSLRIFFEAVGFSPLGGLRKAKQIALLASSICAMSGILVARWGRKVVNTVAGESKLHTSRRNVPIISHVFVCVVIYTNPTR